MYYIRAQGHKYQHSVIPNFKEAIVVQEEELKRVVNKQPHSQSSLHSCPMACNEVTWPCQLRGCC